MFDRTSVPVFSSCSRNILVIKCNGFLIAVEGKDGFSNFVGFKTLLKSSARLYLDLIQK